MRHSRSGAPAELRAIATTRSTTSPRRGDTWLPSEHKAGRAFEDLPRDVSDGVRLGRRRRDKGPGRHTRRSRQFRAVPGRTRSRGRRAHVGGVGGDVLGPRFIVRVGGADERLVVPGMANITRSAARSTIRFGSRPLRGTAMPPSESQHGFASARRADARSTMVRSRCDLLGRVVSVARTSDPARALPKVAAVARALRQVVAAIAPSATADWTVSVRRARRSNNRSGIAPASLRHERGQGNVVVPHERWRAMFRKAERPS